MYTPSIVDAVRSLEQRHQRHESEREYFEHAARDAARAHRAQRRRQLLPIRLGTHRITRPAVAIAVLIAGAFGVGFSL
jgi:ferric-dicitrate binding protein FerR (iron transport regulator)